MAISFQRRSDIASSAHQLQRAAGDIQRMASGSGTVNALPAALAHLEEALDRLATSMVVSSQTVEDWAGAPAGGPDDLDPSARALRWHLAHLGTRLRGAQDACPDARRWARNALLDAHDEAA